MKVKKYEMRTYLNAFIDMGCVTIQDVLDLLDKELKNDNDIVFTKE